MGLKSQVGSVFDLDYLSSLHGIASLRGKVDPNKQGGFKLQVPGAGKQSAVDRTIEVGEDREKENGEGFEIIFQLFMPNATLPLADSLECFQRKMLLACIISGKTFTQIKTRYLHFITLGNMAQSRWMGGA